MIKVENIDISGIEAAVRGMRNPLNSWDKADSSFDPETHTFTVGPNDLDLMKRLYKAGTEHRKYLRMIHVSMDITAPLYWWKEYDTYKVGTVANSCSTMHKIASKEFIFDDFSTEHLTKPSLDCLSNTIDILNDAREWYLKYDSMSDEDKKHFDTNVTCKKDIWWQMIQLLPTSYNQKRTVDFNYENVFTFIRQRSGHKLDEWNAFVDILKNLPAVRGLMEE